MPLCLSFFEQFDADVLGNHADYCRLFGYAHRWVSAERMAPAIATRQYRKYSEILRSLRSLPEGEILLYLDADSMVFHPMALESLMEGRDLLVVDGPPIGHHPGRAMTNMLCLRNTAANRQLLFEVIADTSRAVACVAPALDESARFGPAGIQPCNVMLAHRHVNVTWRMPGWWDSPTFVISLAPIATLGFGGQPQPDAFHDLNLQRLLARQINGALMHGKPVLQPPQYPALSQDPVSTFQPGQSIALVTLYTPNIGVYAHVSEHNVQRYCERHGYTYHVYRGVPAEIDPGIHGAWIKSWLLMRHLPAHEWVIWVDADVIFRNPSRALAQWLQGRDLLFTKDLADWSMNSGFMAFRNTPRNAQLLQQIWQRIGEVADKSDLYSSLGDQYFTNQVLRENGLDTEAAIIDNLEINTPPLLAGPETLMIHFMGLGEPYRSAYMAEMDALSKRA